MKSSSQVSYTDLDNTYVNHNLVSEKNEVIEENWKKSSELISSYIAIILTLIFSGTFLYLQFPNILNNVNVGDWASVGKQAIFLSIVLFLIYGAMIYLLCRLGYIKRLRSFKLEGGIDASIYAKENIPQLSILVPSYKEDYQVIRQTMLSAALQHYPSRSVVLLIDNPPNPDSMMDQKLLEDARNVAKEIDFLLKNEMELYSHALTEWLMRLESKDINIEQEVDILHSLWKEVAVWFENQIRQISEDDGASHIFISEVLEPHYKQAVSKARYWKNRFGPNSEEQRHEIETEYRILDSIFRVDISSFERKKYSGLSHEPNKAMNLNSYISLMGKRYKIIKEETGLRLCETFAKNADISVNNPEYILTLDADSMIHPEYASRLAQHLEQAGNERIAVIQTPYSSFPNAKNMIERVAGATTDMQYIIHQGFSYFSATYWVGANALLRKSALDDIAKESYEHNNRVIRFIQDRTVIEDTESSIDLVAKGWTLFNYPKRLAFSATPPDFGSLIVQRQRWANGGLLILPKLLKYLIQKPFSRFVEGFFRLHYLSSIMAVNFGILFLLMLPLTTGLTSYWLPLTALPYFLLYARDLKLAGYDYLDVFRVYAINILLIPINISGTLKSIQQAIFRTKIPFARTPKINGRTAAPAFYIVVIYLLIAQLFVCASMDYFIGYWVHASFAFINAVFLLYALKCYIGFGESMEDVGMLTPIRENKDAIIEGKLKADFS